MAIGNLFALVVLNGLEMASGSILWVLPLAVGTGYGMMRGIRWRKPRVVLPRAAVWMAIAWVALLTAPRLPYPLHRVPDAQILSAGDDHGRLAELVALTKSPQYPARHPSNQKYLLSHYYGALLPMAWVKFAVPALNLKECIFLGNLLCHVLMAGAVLELASLLFAGARPAVAFVFLMTFFSGLDWVTTLPLLFDHHEHWFFRRFGEWREISSMYTVAVWAVHHAFGMWSVLAAYVVLMHGRWRARWRKPFVVGLLMVSALYASVFVLLSLPFVAWKAIWRIGVRLLKNGLWIPLTALACVPAFLFFGRQTGSAFTISVMGAWPLTVYLCGVLLLDIPLLWWLVRRDRRMLGSLLFFVSCLFVSSIGLNNYTMRGLLIPTVILYACAAPHLASIRWRRPLAASAIALTVIGTVRGAAWLTYRPLETSPLYWEFTGRPMPEFAKVRGRELKGIDRLEREEMVQDVPLEAMDFTEVELLRMPREGWFR